MPCHPKCEVWNVSLRVHVLIYVTFCDIVTIDACNIFSCEYDVLCSHREWQLLDVYPFDMLEFQSHHLVQHLPLAMSHWMLNVCNGCKCLPLKRFALNLTSELCLTFGRNQLERFSINNGARTKNLLALHFHTRYMLQPYCKTCHTLTRQTHRSWPT